MITYTVISIPASKSLKSYVPDEVSEVSSVIVFIPKDASWWTVVLLKMNTVYAFLTAISALISPANMRVASWV